MKKIITTCLLFVSALISGQDSTVIYLNNSGLTYDSAVIVINNPKIPFEEKFELVSTISGIQPTDLIFENIFF